VNPQRVRQARITAGLSLADVAGDTVSRTFILLVEKGRSRPSMRVLEHIARRTGKPVEYFLEAEEGGELAKAGDTLATDITEAAERVRRLQASTELTTPDREAMRLVELTLRQAAAVTRVLVARAQEAAS
jgi:transcriptional regulator with XRE-family HTH domain